MISGYLLYPIIPLLTTIKCKYDHIRLFTHSVFILIHLGTSVILISYSSIFKGSECFYITNYTTNPRMSRCMNESCGLQKRHDQSSAKAQAPACLCIRFLIVRSVEHLISLWYPARASILEGCTLAVR